MPGDPKPEVRPKVCENCNRPYYRLTKCVDWQWAERRYCGWTCHAAAKHRRWCDPDGPPWDEDANGCWLWNRSMSPQGYGAITVNRVTIPAHRWVYELIVGPIPEGLHIDHLCRVTACVNPAHLEPVTAAENIRRGLRPTTNGDHQRAKTHCPRGHPYAGDNLYVSPDGKRSCRICMYASKQRHRQRARERRAAQT
jgi:hypothetical protein